MSRIIVVGSSNTDMVVKTTRFPQPGETIMGGEFYMFPGGKGANQAVAAARLGGEVEFICSIGDDLFGQNALVAYQKEGIDISNSKVNKGQASGVALITVNAEGENEIVVASGANKLLSPSYLQSLATIKTAEYILTQLETPLESVKLLAQIASTNSQKLIINPAPAQNIHEEIFKGLFLITPNETETALLTGVTVLDEKSAKVAAQEFLKKGVQNVIITLGSKGAYFMSSKESFLSPAHQVKAIDTTAAGDVFNGAIVVSLSKGKPWQEALSFANKAAALSVTRMGAQASAPFLKEIEK